MSRGGPYDASRAHGAKYANGAAGLYSEEEKARYYGDAYYANGATKTKANSTLFVRGLPNAIVGEELFGGMPGFIGVRRVRSMTFVDFDSIKSATNAMVRYQGHRLEADQLTPGLVIDYDKDKGVADKRGEEQKRKLESAIERNRSADYYCVACGTKALRTKGSLLSELPSRGTDGAAAVRRAKGVEKQLRLACRSCGASPAYRAARAAPDGPSYLYVHPDRVSLSNDPREAVAAAKRARVGEASEEET